MVLELEGFSFSSENNTINSSLLSYFIRLSTTRSFNTTSVVVSLRKKRSLLCQEFHD